MRWFYIAFMLILGRSLHGEVPVQENSSVVYGSIGAEQLHHAFAEHLKISANQDPLIGYLEFKDRYPISESTYLYVKYALDYFKKKQVAFVIVHLNSFGGEILPTIKIVDLFQKFDVNDGIPLIAFIDQHAVGSGAMIAYGCRFIAVSKDARMGGALTQFPNPQKVWEVPQAYLPYLLNEYASLASLYGRDPVLAEAMVDPSIIIVDRDNKPVRLYSLSEVNKSGNSPDVVLATNETLLTLNAKQLIDYGIADFEILAEGNFFPSDQEKKEGKWPFSKSFLSKEPYLGSMVRAQVIAYHHWTISFLLFLTYPALAALLIVGVIVSFYLQIKSKGFNLSGVIGAVCLVLLIFTSSALQAISLIDVLFLALGLTLIIVDSARKLATGGVVGFLGIGFTVVSLIMLMLPGFEKFSLLDFESSSFVARSVVERVIWIIGALIVSLIAILVIRKVFAYKLQPLPKLPININESGKELDFLERFEDSVLPKEGSEGVAHCSLRPLGKVMIRDRIYEAISEDGKMILKKSHIIVVKHHLGKLVVKQL